MGSLGGGPHPTMGDCGQCLGLGELGCSFISASISSAGLHSACLSICVLITAPGQEWVWRRRPGHRTPGPSWTALPLGDRALLVPHGHLLPCEGRRGRCRGGVEGLISSPSQAAGGGAQSRLTFPCYRSALQERH